MSRNDYYDHLDKEREAKVKAEYERLRKTEFKPDPRQAFAKNQKIKSEIRKSTQMRAMAKAMVNVRKEEQKHFDQLKTE